MFQALRKKHYEMKDAIKLGHQLEEEDEEEEKKEAQNVDGAQYEDGCEEELDPPGNPNMVNGHR